ncbi:hypothetical protein L4C36_06415 [Photobacterium japonica]|uniref:hypothetical protein n=1 Tax=Photobacterium japonica TaxID=2910235 RepID=UPI003D144CBA
MRSPLPTLLLVSSAWLCGCIASNGTIESAAPNSANKMVVIGVPLLLGGFGSAVPVNDRYLITAKHVAQLSWDVGIIYHPDCDLALVPRVSNSVPRWGLIYPDQSVKHLGHSLLGNSIRGEGKYLQDVIDTNTRCLYSLSDAPVMSGMSGGPVFNADGEIAGITIAIVHNPEDLRNLRPAARYSQFLPAPLIFDWLAALGIAPSEASPALRQAQVSEYVTRLNRTSLAPTMPAQSTQVPSATSASRAESTTRADSNHANNTARTSHLFASDSRASSADDGSSTAHDASLDPSSSTSKASPHLHQHMWF